MDMDFSLWALFARAPLVVKIVMILLLAASAWSWSIIINASLRLARARLRMGKFDRAFWSGQPLDDLYDQIAEKPQQGAEVIFAAGMQEWRRSHTAENQMIPNAQMRIDRAMDVAIGREGDALQKRLSVLATVGSTAPFIGLFGTVWGIMRAFVDIAQHQNTNLAVVAPGIAEALLATGLGLVAAIPAVVFYNKLASDADRLIAQYENFADEFATLLSRQMGG